MESEQLTLLRRQTPFRPFRVKLVDGRCYDVLNPELLSVGPTDVSIGFPRPGSDKPYFFERKTTVDLDDIKEIEFLEAASSSASH